jgi:uncharacterized membrane protein HdeD (DUF308 family)
MTQTAGDEIVAAGVPVNDQDSGWQKQLFGILGILALIAGIVLAAFAPSGVFPGILLSGLGVVLLIVNKVRSNRQKAAERWVVDTGNGFRWLGGPTDVEVPDSQVVAVRIKRTSKFSAGIFKGTVRRFEVWTADSDRPMSMTNRLGVNVADPLAPLIARVIEDLKQRTAAGLASGAVLEGEGWQLAAMQLLVARGRAVEALPFAEIDKVAVFDGKICIWRRGQDEPAAKISPDSKNASVLASLLTQWIEHQREASGGDSSEALDSSGMGRLLFERRRYDGLWMAFICSIVIGAAGMVLLFDRNATRLGAVLVGAAVVSLLLGVVFGRYRFRCFERGLSRRRNRDEFRLRYDEIREFTYAATRMFYKGTYVGTRLRLTFRAPQGTIRYSAKVQNMDADLDELRDHLAKTIAVRMLSDLRAGHAVPWMNDVVFLPQGLQFRRSKMLGLASGPPEVLPYQQIRGVNINEGVSYLYSTTEAKPVICRPAESPNFFPGYFTVLTLLDQNMPNSSRAASVINSGDQGGESVTSTLTSPAPSNDISVSRTSATS